ncbi:MAG: GNAT family N-acetyltransferase, partial [Methanomassiliicoccales archaeon]
MEIKEMEKDDIPKVVEFFGEVVPSAQQKEADMNNFESELNKSLGKDHFLMALEDETVIGFLRSRIQEDKFGRILDMVTMLLISPERYGQGIGGALME